MRSARRTKSTAHIALGFAVMACSFWQMDNHPAVFAWLIPTLFGFLTIALEIPEIVRRDCKAFDALEIAVLRRSFEAHCRTGG